MRLNRALQLQLMNTIADQYPRPVFERGGIDFKDLEVIKNLVYLEQHHLIQLTKAQFNEGGYKITVAQATQRGMDFLEDDGGLSAILGVVTIKLHDETIKHLVARTIQEADLPEPEKQRMTLGLQQLPAETTKHLAMKLVDLGLESGPQAIAAIGKFLGL